MFSKQDSIESGEKFRNRIRFLNLPDNVGIQCISNSCSTPGFDSAYFLPNRKFPNRQTASKPTLSLRRLVLEAFS